MQTTHITPEPDEAEREAILSALAAEKADKAGSEWATALLPPRDDEPRDP